jgi:hypothetical protein
MRQRFDVTENLIIFLKFKGTKHGLSFQGMMGSCRRTTTTTTLLDVHVYQVTADTGTR